jgi:hypothetical protein
MYIFFIRYIFFVVIMFSCLSIHAQRYERDIEERFYWDTLVRYYTQYLIHEKSTVTPAIRDTLSRLIHKESLRFKQALHPVFQAKDTLALLDKKWPGWRTRNPLCILAEHLCDCEYAPEYTVENLVYRYRRPTDWSQDRRMRNFFQVNKKDRFIRIGKDSRRDTIYEDVSHRFFPFDSVFTACYIPPTGVRYLTGGNVFSDTINFLHIGRFDGKYHKHGPDYETCMEVVYNVKMAPFGFGPIYYGVFAQDSLGHHWFRLTTPDDKRGSHGDGYLYFVSFSKNNPQMLTYHEYYYASGGIVATLTYINRPKSFQEVMAFTLYKKTSKKEVDFITEKWRTHDGVVMLKFDYLNYLDASFIEAILRKIILDTRKRYSKYGTIKVVDGAWGEQ